MACTSGLEALKLLQAAPQAFDLVITDQTMLGMTREALARDVGRMRPDLPIMLCSGHGAIITREEAEALSMRGYLAKPILRRDLDLAIRQVLDQAYH